MSEFNVVRAARESYALAGHDAAAICAELDDAAHDERGRLEVVPASTYRAFTPRQRSIWCVLRGYYCLPTTELIEALGPLLESPAIEIGAGNGALGRALSIPMTDSYQQTDPRVREHYQRLRQQTVPYEPDVERLDSSDAINRYQPATVLGAWVTHRYDPNCHHRGGNEAGIDESAILQAPAGVRYVFVGHRRVHQSKPILGVPHQTLEPDGLFSRALDPHDVIWVWP